MELPLSIIIPTRNEEQYLARLLQSIKSQTHQPAEIIVADAHSIDKTRDIARLFDCKVVTGGNHPSIGRNKGAAVAKSKILLFLDADVVLPDKSFLFSTIREFEERNLGVACCLAFVSSHNPIDQIGINVSNTFYSLTETMIKNGVGYCTFILKTIHQRIGGFSESIVVGEDQDYVTRASKLGKFRFLKSKKIVISLRRHIKEGRVKLMLKYFYLYALLLLGKKATKGKIPYSFNHRYIKDS